MNHLRTLGWITTPFALGAALVLSGCGTPQPKSPPSRAGQAKPGSIPANPAAPPAPATHAAARGTLKRTLQVDAVVESLEIHPIRIEPEAWNDLTVLDAVSHGARVKAGDVLVKLDTEKIREQLNDLEQDRPGADLALLVAQAELQNLTQATPNRLEAAKRSRRIADEDLAYFDRAGRERREKTAQMNLKSAEQRLENSTEELKQLEKMYKADDLTEETEEIVLKRQRVEVEFAQFGLDSSRLSTERELNTFIPREAETLKTNQRDQVLAQELSEETLPKALARKQFDVEKMRRDQKKSEKRLADLQHDLQAMDVRAPSAGLVIHGACENGKWTTGPAVTKKLVPGGKLMPFEVFMTVLNPDRIQLKAVVPEAELGKAKVGLAGEAAPVANLDRKLAVKLEAIDPIPMVTGGFEATLSLPAGAAGNLVPGMNCKVTLTEAARPSAILAPSEAVFTDGDGKCVYVAKSGGGHEKRTVKTGESDGKQTEILDGLQENERVLLKKPE